MRLLRGTTTLLAALLLVGACNTAPPHERNGGILNFGRSTTADASPGDEPAIIDLPAGTNCKLADRPVAERLIGEPLPVTAGGGSNTFDVCRYQPTDRMSQFQVTARALPSSSDALNYMLKQRAVRKQASTAGTAYQDAEFLSYDGFIQCGPLDVIAGFHKRDRYVEVLVAGRPGSPANCGTALSVAVEAIVLKI